jgi:hypothetical protein
MVLMVLPHRRKMEESYNDLIKGNHQWVEQQLEKDPDLFKRLSAGQSPQVLWIGCSDSRVPANVITGSDPGKSGRKRTCIRSVRRESTF